MRVSLVVPDTLPSSGGLARNVPRLAGALRNHGVSVELCSVGDGSAVTPQMTVPAFHGRPAWPSTLGRSPELKRHLRDTPTDLIHANGLWMAPLGYAATAAARRQIPLVISPRGMLSPWALRRSRWKKLLARWLVHRGAFRRAAGWHVTSVAEESDIRRLGFSQPICMAPNGVDPPREAPGDVRAFYEAVAPAIVGCRVVLFYSRFHSKKRVCELIQEFATLPTSDWHLLVVGVPEEYSVQDLRGQVASLAASPRVTVLDGQDLPKPYAVADFMALPTHEENFGQVIAEALAAGVPVLTTTNAPWEGLQAAGAGRWVPFEQFGATLREMMTLPTEALQAAGNRGRDWVLATFSWDGSAAVLKRFYEQVLVSTARLA